MPRGNNAGGKRQGSGRQYKVPALAVAPALPAASQDIQQGIQETKKRSRASKEVDTSAMPAYTPKGLDLLSYNLTDKQRLAALLIARGKHQAAAAREVGVAKNTVTTWKQTLPEFNRLIVDVQSLLVIDPMSAFGPLIPKAIEAYEHLLQKDNFKAAQDTIDRVFGKPLVRQQVAGVMKAEINIINKTEHEITKYIETDDD
jgi:hypothetical protein